jgi:hypothetical protein
MNDWGAVRFPRRAEKTNPYITAVEPRPDPPDHEVHKVKLAVPIPETFEHIASDAIINLCAGLDYAG